MGSYACILSRILLVAKPILTLVKLNVLTQVNVVCNVVVCVPRKKAEY